MKLTTGMFVLGALLLQGCAGRGNLSNPAGALAGSRYVAMGSSFAAGTGIEPTKAGTPRRCGRSLRNYATRLAESLRLTLYDATCGGATTEHVLGPWDELPAQIEAVTADTRLVTVTVGGNDVNYVGNLFAASCREGAPVVIDGRELPCVPPRFPADADFQRLAANLRAIAEQVRSRAPKARLVFVQYLKLVPDTLCDVSPLLPEEAEIARATAARLAEVTSRAAKDSGAMLIEADQLSTGHTPCDEEPWSFGYPAPDDGRSGIAWHPNAAGHAAIAAELARRLVSGRSR